MLFSILLVVSCTLTRYTATAMEQQQNDPFVLTSKNINEQISQYSGAFVMYHAPWCGHCKSVKVVWDTLAGKYNKLQDKKYLISKIDCTLETEMCSDHDILAYPTFVFYKEKTNDGGMRYTGDRTVASFEAFIISQFDDSKPVVTTDTPVNVQLPNQINELIVLDEQNFEQTIQAGYFFIKFYAPWCSHCVALAPTWKELATIYNNANSNVRIADVDCTKNTNLCNKYEVKGYPTLLLFQNGKLLGGYDSGRTLDKLTSFISEMVQETNNLDKIVTKPPPLEEGPTDAIEITADTYDKYLTDANYVFVKYYAPWCGHCKRLAPVWDQLSARLSTNAKVMIGKIDCTTNSDFCAKQNINAYPTLVLYRNGKYLREYTEHRDLDSLYNFITNYIDHDEL